MPYKPVLKDIFGKQPVITGGTRTFEVGTLSDIEVRKLDEFLDKYALQLHRASPAIAEDFIRQKSFFKDVCCIAKARFDNKPLNEDEVAELPRAGQLGVSPLIAQDLSIIGEVAPLQHNTWDIAAVAGTPVYIFGSAGNWFVTRGAVMEQRSMIAIMKNGLIEVGATPSINQIRFWTAAAAYPPWRTSILKDVCLESDKPIYQYHSPAAFILTPDLGTRMQVMPVRTGNISARLVGLVFGEYNYFNTTGVRGVAGVQPFIWNPTPVT